MLYKRALYIIKNNKNSFFVQLKSTSPTFTKILLSSPLNLAGFSTTRSSLFHHNATVMRGISAYVALALSVTVSVAAQDAKILDGSISVEERAYLVPSDQNIGSSSHSAQLLKREDTSQQGAEDKTENGGAANGPSLPEPLTEANFNEETSKMLTFVEFFSPSCHHCRQLAPIWEETYKSFAAEMEKMNIQMRQVNCLASGDLCDREGIVFYPNLLLYSPEKDKNGKIIAGKLKNVGTMPRSLSRTPENFKKYLRNAVAEYDSGDIDLPGLLESLSVDLMLDLVAGKAEEPVFVAFFPATFEELNNSAQKKNNQFLLKCPDCFESKLVWDRLLNHILSTHKTGHFACRLNPNICQRLGYKIAANPARYGEPQYAMFLPKSAGVIRINYLGPADLPSMKAWATRMFENFHYNKVTMRTLGDLVDLKDELPWKPIDLHPVANKQALVYYYEPEKEAEEDGAIMPYLLEFVSKSPFNIYLYKAKKSKNYEKLLSKQHENIIKFINGPESSTEEKSPRYVFSEEMYLATTLTLKPTLLLFKDNSLMTPIYQNFAVDDMRDAGKIETWFLKNQFPLYQELTPDLFEFYFSTKLEKKKNFNDKIVVSFVDSQNTKDTPIALYNMSLVAHEYNIMKKNFYFDKLVKDRASKKQAVNKLKDLGALSTKIINRMKIKIPHYFDYDDVLFVYVDVSQHPQMAKKLGWDVSNHGYGQGDCIVVSKDGHYYWDTSVDGKRLKMVPGQVLPLLRYLLDSDSFTGAVRTARKLVGSPYSDSLRFMDTVHNHGFFGYILAIGALYTTVVGIHKVRKRRSSRGEQGMGILGGKED